MSTTRPSIAARLAQLTMLAIVAILPACASVQREQVASWREAVAAAREQSNATFKLSNELIRDSQLRRARELSKITEADFTPGLDAASVARWNAAFDALTTYASAIEQLLDPKRPAGVGASLKAAGEQLGTTASIMALRKDGPISSAVGALGAKLIAASASSSARDIMLQTDPAVRDVTSHMASMLLLERLDADGDPVRVGVQATVGSTWDMRLAELEAQFASAQPAERPAILEKYVKVVAQKQDAVASIASLRQSILALAPAHTAAAQGRSADVGFVIAQIREEVKTVKALLDELRAAR